MAVDPVSPIAPARIRVLLLPVGKIKRSRFATFVGRLQRESLIRLGDVSPDTRPDRNMFSPLAFPAGMVLYDMSTTLPSPSYLALSPVELFREPLLAIGIADAAQYPSPVRLDASSAGDDEPSPEPTTNDVADELSDALPFMREQYPGVLVHRLLIFESPSHDAPAWLPPDAIHVPPEAQLKTTTMKTIVCDITSLLLAEMTALAKSIDALPSLAFPTHPIGADHPSHTPRPLSRRTSQIDASSRSASPFSRTPAAQHRMSMPVGLDSTSLGPSGPGSRPLSSAEGDAAPHAPSLDHTSAADASTRGSPLSRPAALSRTASTRSAQRSPVPLTGFGSSSVKHHEREIHRLRIRLVHGCMFLMTGLWTEALPHFAEVTMQAEALKDGMSHIKGLELILCSLLLLCRTKTSVEIPPIAFLHPDRPSGSKALRHSSASSLGSVSKGSASDRAHDRDRLARAIPGVVDVILDLLKRSSTGPGEDFPQPAKSEMIIRLVNLLIALQTFGGLTDEALGSFLRSAPAPHTLPERVTSGSAQPNRTEIASILFAAYPSAAAMESIPSIVVAEILAKISRACALMGLARKRQFVQEELIKMLTVSLQHARTTGAADVGLHPAAGLASALELGSSPLDARSDFHGRGRADHERLRGFLDAFIGHATGSRPTRSVRDAAMHRLSDSHHQMDLVRHLTDDQAVEILDCRRRALSPSDGLTDVQVSRLSSCMRLCEALNDFRGYLQFASCQLRSAIAAPHPPGSVLPPITLHEAAQHSIYHGIQRAVASAQEHMDRSIHADYWDPFLVRDVSAIAPDGRHAIEEFRASTTRPNDATVGSRRGVFIHNPFSHVPNDGAPPATIVSGEPYGFQVALRNPFAFSAELESIRLVSNGVALDSLEHDVELPGSSVRRLTITARARGEGTAHIVGCQVKMKACRERFFPVLPDDGGPQRDHKLKQHDAETSERAPLPAFKLVSLTVIRPQPVLEISRVSEPQHALMLLENERRTVSVDLSNLSSDAGVSFIHAEIKSVHQTPDDSDGRSRSRADRHDAEWQATHRPPARLVGHDPVQAWLPVWIPPMGTERLDFDLIGQPSLTGLEFVVHYRTSDADMPPDKVFARQVACSLRMTVLPAIQVKLAGVISCPRATTASASLRGSGGPTRCLLRVELQNRWTAPLLTHLSAAGDTEGERDDVDADQPPRSPSVRSTLVPPTGPSDRCTVLLPVPTLDVSAPHEQIPLSQQFIYDTNLTSAEDMANREAFWYRAKLFELVHGSWEDVDGTRLGRPPRSGEIVLRGQTLSADMLDALKRPQTELEISIVAPGPRGGPAQPIGGRTPRWECQITLRNSLTEPTTGVLFVEFDKIHRESSGASMHLPIRGFSPDLNGTLHVLDPESEAVVRMWALELHPGEISVRAQIHDDSTGRVEATAVAEFMVPDLHRDVDALSAPTV